MKRDFALALTIGLVTASARAQDTETSALDVAAEQTLVDGPGADSSPPDGDAPELEELSASDLATLGLDADKPGVDTSFQFSGFADFTSYFPVRPRGPILAALPRSQTFYVGNVNVYLGKNLSEDFRMLGEVRFTYLPNGGLDTSKLSFSYASTHVTDYADNAQSTSWGGIILQRLYLEWTLHRYLAVRGGQFLTPYGIWNVDHGSPAYIPVQRPYANNSNYFPERQTGLELLGRWDATNHLTTGYHLTLSNGAGPVSEYRDIDKNKAIGARLYLEHHGAGFLRIGASGYYGRETNGVPLISVMPQSIEVGQSVTTQFDGLSLAADLSYSRSGLLLQTEWVTQQRRHTDTGRLARPQFFAPVARAFPRDSLSWAGYVLAAYTLSWYALTPYVVVQRTRQVLPTSFPDYALDAWLLSGGFNVRPIDEVVFKAEFSYTWFDNGGPVLRYPVSYVQLQAAWAF